MTLKVISLFSGAGGLDLGLEAAGFTNAICVEMDTHACMTLAANKGWRVIQAPLQDVSSRKLLSNAGLRKGEATLLAGGPPCQPFSKAGYWHTGDTLRMSDPRAATVKEYLRVLEDALPEAFLLENVPGFAYESKSEGLDFFLRGLKKINRDQGTRYSANWTTLNAVDYGVPQRRERLFIIGARDGSQFQFPPATHGEDGQHVRPYLTAWDSIGDLDKASVNEDLELSGKWAELLPSIPEGWNYLWHTEKGGGVPLFEWRSRYWNFLLKLAKDKPSWTIQAQPGPATGPFHWRNRRLSSRELCRLQTFPEGYAIAGAYRQVLKQVGNAVPSALAELLGLQIRKQLFGDRVRSELSLIPKRSRFQGRAYNRRPVPEAYL